MDRSFRFVHAGDLHLERPPRGLAEVPDHLRGALADAPLRAAERVFAAALKHQVDFLLLAGDVIDPAAAGPRAMAFLEEQFDRLSAAGIHTYWAGGRSDRFDHWLDAWPLPAGVTRFGLHEVERVLHYRASEPLVEILGTSTIQRKRIHAAEFRRDNAALFSVAVAYGTTDAETLVQHAINYWALGGEHQRRSVVAGPITGHYSGSPQGRKPAESGPRGCTLVEVDDAQRIRTSFLPTDAVRYYQQHLTVDAGTTLEQLYQLLNERTAGVLVDPFGPELLVSWTISGSPTLERQLRLGKTAADLAARLRVEHGHKKPAAWTVSIEPEGSGGIAAGRYDEQTLLGEFLRTVRHYSEHPDAAMSLEGFLAERHVASSLGALAALDEPGVRGRVLAEVAALGVELLSPREGTK